MVIERRRARISRAIRDHAPAERGAIAGIPGRIVEQRHDAVGMEIVLMHCGPAVTPAILPGLIRHYACAGYRFVTVAELLTRRSGGQGERGLRATERDGCRRISTAPERVQCAGRDRD